MIRWCNQPTSKYHLISGNPSMVSLSFAPNLIIQPVDARTCRDGNEDYGEIY